VIDFPPSPTYGQKATTSAGSYTWDGVSWTYSENARPMASFTDTFDGSTFKAPWIYYSSTVQAGRAKIPMDWNYSGLETPPLFTVKGSSLSAKIVPPAASRTSIEISMEAGTQLRINYEYLNTGMVIYADMFINRVESISPIYPYDPVNHAWWRIRESGGTVYFETAPDGLTWTTFYSRTFTVAAYPEPIIFNIGDYNIETATDFTYIDNVNVAP
jgi:hypothetical protein